MQVNTVASGMGMRSAYTGMTLSTRVYAQGGSAEAATQVLKAAMERGDDDPDLVRLKP